MSVCDVGPVTGRRVVVLGAVALALVVAGATPARAQDPAPAPQQPDQYTFTADSMLMFIGVAESATADFEGFMAQVKDVLTKSEKPERKQQAESWRLVKIETPQNGVITYALMLEKVVKGTSYDLFRILSEGLPPDKVKEIYDKVGPHIKSLSFAPIRFVH
jgi:hypothetical protein